MLIDDTHFPFEPAWAGALESPAVSFAKGPGELPKVSIGQPVWWSDPRKLGADWVQPAGGKRYGMARFAYSLTPVERQTVDSVEFTLSFNSLGSPQRPIAFDLMPGLTTEEQTGKRKFTLDPKMKFANVVEFSGIQAGVEIDVKQAHVVSSIYGLGESDAGWTFKARPAHPLVGSQMVFVILEIPPDAQAARVTVRLSAQVDAPLWGKMRGQLPEEAQAQTQFVLQDN